MCVLVHPTRFVLLASRTAALAGDMGRNRNDTLILALADVIKTVIGALVGAA